MIVIPTLCFFLRLPCLFNLHYLFISSTSSRIVYKWNGTATSFQLLCIWYYGLYCLHSSQFSLIHRRLNLSGYFHYFFWPGILLILLLMNLFCKKTSMIFKLLCFPLCECTWDILLFYLLYSSCCYLLSVSSLKSLSVLYLHSKSIITSKLLSDLLWLNDYFFYYILVYGDVLTIFPIRFTFIGHVILKYYDLFYYYGVIRWGFSWNKGVAPYLEEVRGGLESRKDVGVSWEFGFIFILL